MSYVIADPCLGQKDKSCVEVCPVDCIDPTRDEPEDEKDEQLYIDPESASTAMHATTPVRSEPVRRVGVAPEWAKYAEINANYFKAGRRGLAAALPHESAKRAALGRPFFVLAAIVRPQ